MNYLVNISSQTRLINPLDLSLVAQALTIFEKCACIPEPNLNDNNLIKLIFSSGLLLMLGNCGECNQEIRWQKNQGSTEGRLLLISEENQMGDFFRYNDVLLVQAGKLWRLDLPLAVGRKFLTFEEAAPLYRKGKIPDLGKRTLLAIIYDCPPLVRYLGKKGLYWGLDIDMMKALSQALNFRIKYLELNSTDVFGLETNGTWIGGVNGALVSGEVDVGLCGAWMKEKEMKHVDVIPYEEVALGFIISKILTEEKWKSIYSPFSWSLWGCILFMVIVSFCSMYFLSKLSGNKEGFVDWIFLVFGHFMGCTSLPAVGPDPFRVAVVAVAIASLMFTTLYSSAILSHLTQPPAIPPPETVKDLVNRGYYWSRSRPLKDPKMILNEADEWQRKFITRYRNISEMGPAIKKRRFAYYLSNIGELFLWRDLPRASYDKGNTVLVQMKEVISRTPIGVATRKGSTITEHFKLAINRLVTSGVINKFRQEKESFIKIQWKSRESPPVGLQPLSLAALQGAFFIMVCGILIAIVAFIVEVSIDRKQKAKK